MFTDILFFVDMFVTANTGLYQNGVLIMNRRWVIIEYIKYGIVIDILSTFPYTYIIIWMQQDAQDEKTNMAYN
jgi:hypothetical protein